jgi:2-polyprenyl-6-methoxyphenol hydroxylase-like FAD-dependent oxidoreductase
MLPARLSWGVRGLICFHTYYRPYLRKILLDSLNPDTVRYNMALKSVGPLPGSGHKNILTFKNGSLVEADLVIGADGAWSKVKRRLGSDAPQPIYAGLQVTFLCK